MLCTPSDILRCAVYPRRSAKQVSRWGNSLAIRIPAAVVEALQLKEGDDIEVRILGDRALAVDRDCTREQALERIRAFRKQLPADWKLDREEANAR